MKVIDIIKRSLDRITRVTSNIGLILASIALLLVIFFTSGAVTARDFFSQNWIWAMEWSGYSLIFISYFGVAYCLRAGGHISVTSLHDRFPSRVKMIVDPILTLLALGVTVMMFTMSSIRFFQALQTGSRSMSPLEIPLWIPYSFIPIGLVLLFLELVAHFFHLLTARRTTEMIDEHEMTSVIES